MGAKNTRILPHDEKTRKTFENLCMIQCTVEEIAGVFEVGRETLLRWCRENYNQNFELIYKRYSAAGRMSLRRFQYRQAENNAVMGIWLGKQYLGQSDQANIRITNEDEDDALTQSIKNSIAKRKAKKVLVDDEDNEEEE